MRISPVLGRVDVRGTDHDVLGSVLSGRRDKHHIDLQTLNEGERTKAVCALPSSSKTNVTWLRWSMLTGRGRPESARRCVRQRGSEPSKNDMS